MLKRNLIIAAVAFSLGFGTGAHWQNLLRTIDKLTREASDARGFAVAAEKTAGLAQTFNNIETDTVKGMTDATKETDQLRADVDAGAVSLRVAAECPKVPGAAASASGDHGGGARLTPAAQSAYFAVRDGIKRCQKKLKGAQEILKEERRGH